MKRILLICAMVALVGCGKKETQPPSPPTPATPQAAETQAPELTPKPAGEPVQEESLAGTYQVMLPNGTFTLILLEDGKVMVEQVSNAGVKNPENSGRGTWIAKNGEVVVTGGDTEMLFKINPNGTLTAIANITNGKREDVPKELQKLMVLSKPLAVPVTGESEATVGGAPKAEPPKAKVKKPLTKEESAKVIEAAIRKAAKKPAGELTKADYEKVTRLRLDSNQLTDVTGLEKLTQLTYLFLDNNKLTNVKGLEKLTQLEELHLGGNKLTSVKGLEKLTQLGVLALNDNQLTSVKDLEKLNQLKVLNLSGNKLTSVKGLEKLNQLKMLYLYDNQLTDVTDLEKLTQLQKLFLDGNQLTDVKGLEKLTQLKILDLNNNPDLTKAQIDELQKALPKCEIRSNFTK